MADDIDATDVRQQVLLDAQIKQLSAIANAMPVGIHGECQACGEQSLRLVFAFNPIEQERMKCCAPCRDSFTSFTNVKRR